MIVISFSRAGNNERILHYTPQKSCRFVIAICVLHNLPILARLPQYLDIENPRNEHVNEDEPEDEEDVDNPDEHLNDLRLGRAVRAHIVDHLERHR